MGAHLIFFIIFTLFSCIILTNQSLPWYSLQSGFQCDTKMAAVFSCMRPTDWEQAQRSGPTILRPGQWYAMADYQRLYGHPYLLTNKG